MKKTQFVVKLTSKSGPETFVKMPSIFTTHQLSSCPVFSRQNLEAPTGPRDLQRRWGGYEETGWDFVLFRVRHFMKNLAKISNCLWSLHDYWHYDISSHGILKLTYSMACYSKTTSPEVFGDRPGIELEEDVDCRGPSQLPKDHGDQKIHLNCRTSHCERKISIDTLILSLLKSSYISDTASEPVVRSIQALLFPADFPIFPCWHLSWACISAEESESMVVFEAKRSQWFDNFNRSRRSSPSAPRWVKTTCLEARRFHYKLCHQWINMDQLSWNWKGTSQVIPSLTLSYYVPLNL